MQQNAHGSTGNLVRLVIFFGLSRCLDYEIRSADIHQILYEHVFHGHNYIRTISHHLDKKFQQ